MGKPSVFSHGGKVVYMVEFLVLLGFCMILAVGFIFNFSLNLSLFFGLILFSGYVVFYRKKSIRELCSMVWSGIRTVGSVIPVFVLIGILTALWRSSGTIASVISYVSGLIYPSVMLLVSFLLCSLVSFLTGTALGTAATMGIICMTMGKAMGIPPVILGGAVLSGAFFGDRCSPVASSMLLVCEMTHTDPYDNLRRMAASVAVPFLITAVLYAVIGAFLDVQSGSIPIRAVFSREFLIHPVALIPAVLILVLALFRINVKISMIASISAAVLISFFLQHQSIPELARTIVLGFSARDPEVASMLNGGGLVSTADVLIILVIAAAFGGIFRHTQLLSGIKQPLVKIAEKSTPFAAVFCAALISSIIACDQVLAIVMTYQLCEEIEPDPARISLALEDTAFYLSPLMPWSVGARVLVPASGAPRASLAVAFLMYLLPLCSLIRSFMRKHRTAA